MTDAEISRQLALAIGWVNVREIYSGYIYTYEKRKRFGRHFDYRDPAVIWPIAERFDCFPVSIGKRWAAQKQDTSPIVWAETATKAVALAVIKAHEERFNFA